MIKLEEDLLERTKQAAKATDEYVQDNPWKAVGAGAVIGVLFGLLLSSSRR